MEPKIIKWIYLGLFWIFAVYINEIANLYTIDSKITPSFLHHLLNLPFEKILITIILIISFIGIAGKYQWSQVMAIFTLLIAALVHLSDYLYNYSMVNFFSSSYLADLFLLLLVYAIYNSETLTEYLTRYNSRDYIL